MFNNAALLLHVDVITFFVQCVYLSQNYAKHSQRETRVQKETETSVRVKTV